MSIVPLDRHVIVASGPQEFREAGRLSELERCKYLVLLGEPGLGKTEALRFLATRSGAIVHSSSLFDMEIDGGDDSLFIDGLDEVSLEAAVKIGMSFLRARQSKWRVTCRVEAWSPEGRLGMVFGSTRAAIDDEPVIAYLQPLGSDEIDKILYALGCANPELFLARLESLGSTPFISSPLGLKFLTSLPVAQLQVLSRADLYESGVTALAEEHNKFKAEGLNRLPTSELLDLAGRIFLTLLLCGKHGIQKRVKDYRTVDGDALGLTSQQLDGVLDTALFIRNGDLFTSMHRSVQEFLAARYLARAVAGLVSGPQVPPYRAIALLESMDGRPPSHLKPLYAWYAAQLESLGLTSEAMSLLQRDPECILLFGDSGRFSAKARRYLLNVIGIRDPYFRDERGAALMSLAGFITEDIADAAASILSNSSESSHRLNTVLQAITDSSPIRVLAERCRDVVLRAGNNIWCTSQALKAWAHCCQPSEDDIWELVEELSRRGIEDLDEYRYRLIAQAFTLLPAESLTVEDVCRIVRAFTPAFSNVRPGIYAVRDISWHIARSPIWRTLILSNPYSWCFEYGHGSVQHRLASGVCIAALALDESINGVDMAKMLVATGCITGPKSPPSFEVSAKNWLERQHDHDSIGRALCEVFDRRMMIHGSISMGFKIINLKPTLNFCHWMLTDVVLSTQLEPEYVGSQAIRIYTDQDTDLEEQLFSLVNSLVKSPTINAAHFQLEQHKKYIEEQAIKKPDQVEELIASLGAQMRLSSGFLEQEQHKQVAFWGAALYCGEYWQPGRNAHVIGIESIRGAFGDELTGSVLENIISVFRSDSLDENNVRVAGMDLLLERGDCSALEKVDVGQIILAFIASCSVRNAGRRDSVRSHCLERLSRCVEIAPALVEKEMLKPNIVALLSRTLRFWLSSTSFHAWFARRALNNTFDLGVVHVMDVLTIAGRNLSLGECVEAAENLIVAFEGGEQSNVSARDMLNLGFWAAQISPDLFSGKFNTYLSGCSHDVIHQVVLSEYQSHISELDESSRLRISSMLIEYFISCSESPWYRDKYWADVYKVLNVLVTSNDESAIKFLNNLLVHARGTNWEDVLRHEIEKTRRLWRDQAAIEPSPEKLLSVLNCSGPINAEDLRALLVSELEGISGDIQSSSLNDWRLYWEGGGEKRTPKVENDCRDAIAVKLRERLRGYGNFVVEPEAASSGYTRADIKISYKDFFVPIEVKRTSHGHLWFGHTGQLQTYTLSRSSQQQGIYLVFWFGTGFSVTKRPDGSSAPDTPSELKEALAIELGEQLGATTSVVVMDVSDAARAARERKEGGFVAAKAQRAVARKAGGNGQESN
jgi:hypothetical protein